MRRVMEYCVDHSLGFAPDEMGSPERALSQACPDQSLALLVEVVGEMAAGLFLMAGGCLE